MAKKHPTMLALVVLMALALQANAIKVLLIGSSLSAGLSGPLQNTLGSKGNVPFTILDASAGGASLRLHCDETINVGNTGVNTLQTIRTGGWDFVVLQEQSSAYIFFTPPLGEDYGRLYTNPLTNRTEFTTYPAILATEARAAGAKPLFLMTWSYQGGFVTADIDAAYTYVGALLNALVAPAGLLFAALTAQGVPVLADDIHPSAVGSYAAACMLYLTMFGSLPAGLSTTVGSTTLENMALSTYQTYKTQQLAACTHTMCIPFVLPNGTLTTPPPPASTTPTPSTTATTTSTTPSVTCRNFSASNALNSTFLDPSQIVSLASELSSYCVTDWRPCFVATSFAPNLSFQFHAACDNRGPTLAVMKVGPLFYERNPSSNPSAGRIFGGFSPISYRSSSDFLSAVGGWLFRFNTTTSALQNAAAEALQVVPIPAGIPAIIDFPSRCPSFGFSDLQITSECNVGTAEPSFADASGYGPNASDWLAGADSAAKSWQLSVIEVLYSPTLASPPTSTTTTTSTTSTTTTQRTTTTTGTTTVRVVVTRTTTRTSTQSTLTSTSTLNATALGPAANTNNSTSIGQQVILGVVLLILAALLTFVVIFLVRRKMAMSKSYEPPRLLSGPGHENPLFADTPSTPGYSSMHAPDDDVTASSFPTDLPLVGLAHSPTPTRAPVSVSTDRASEMENMQDGDEESFVLDDRVGATSDDV